jgi:biotin transport system substrate-specific component
MINLLYSIIAAVAIGAGAQLSISLPESVSVLPITGQTLMVLLAAKIQKWPWAIVSLFIYFALGIIGLPVFTDFNSGWAVFTGNSLGYFIGFIAAAILIHQMHERQSNRFGPTFIQFLLASLVILLFGFLGLLRFVDPLTAFQKGVFPFLAGALVKVFVAAALISAFRRFRQLMEMK